MGLAMKRSHGAAGGRPRGWQGRGRELDTVTCLEGNRDGQREDWDLFSQ